MKIPFVRIVESDTHLFMKGGGHVMTKPADASSDSLAEEQRRTAGKLGVGWLKLWGYLAAIAGGITLLFAAPSGLFPVHRYGWLPAIGVLLYAFGCKVYSTYVVWRLRENGREHAERKLVARPDYMQLAHEQQQVERRELDRRMQQRYKEPNLQTMWVRSLITSAAFFVLYLVMVFGLFDVAWLINLIPKQGSGVKQMLWFVLTGLFVIIGLCCYMWLCQLMPHRIRKRPKKNVPVQTEPVPGDSFLTKRMIQFGNWKRRREARSSRLSPAVRFGVAWIVSFVVFNLAMMILYGLSKNGAIAHLFN